MFNRLFSPVRIGNLEIKNRVAMTAMGLGLGAPGGGVNDDVVAFYEARARGGVGLMISGICRVMDGAGAGEPCQIAARDERDVSGLERLFDAVHKYGARMFVQLQHPGPSYGGEEQPVSASAAPASGRTPRALTVPEIEAIEAAFARGAYVAKLAGADGVELHGAHGYLINSFLSPYLNKREDRYGGALENRMRFLLETISRIREACGRDFPLGVRISAEEFLGPEGNDLAVACRMAEALEGAGIDFLDVSSALGVVAPGFSGLASVDPGTFEQGWKKYMAAEIRKHVKLPLIAVANVKEPVVAEAILEEGCCDLVGVARGHLADPEWCNKARTGREEAIRKCIGCCVCIDEIVHGRHVKCSVNPVTGREREFAHLKKDGAGRPVAVIGAGPAGLTAAIVLKEREFEPVVFDPSLRPGGALNIADKAAHREKITRFVDSLIARAEELGVDMRLGEEATVDMVQALAPCGVFIACGAKPFAPPVEGVHGDNVVAAEDILLRRARPEGACVVIGSGMTGLETAEVLVREGRATTIVDMLPHIGAGADMITVGDLLQRLAPFGPVYMPGHRLAKITKDGVHLERADNGAPVFVPARTVVLALGVRPQTAVVEKFKAAFPDAQTFGDAVRGGRIISATQDAYGQAFVFEPYPFTGGQE